MSLRLKFFFISAITLILPWAGCHYIGAMEQVLRANEEATLTQYAGVIVRSLTNTNPDKGVFEASAPLLSGYLHAYPNDHAIRLDGYADDWLGTSRFYHTFEPYPPDTPPLKTATASNTDSNPQSRGQAVFTTYENHLFILIRVTNAQVQLHDPNQNATPSGERIKLIIGHNPDKTGTRKTSTLTIYATAPGKALVGQSPPTSAHAESPLHAQVQSYWQMTPKGFNVEIALPIDLVRRGMSLQLLDAQQHLSCIQPCLAANSQSERSLHHVLIADQQLSDQLSEFLYPDLTIFLTNQDGWMLTRMQAGQASENTGIPGFWMGLLHALYRALLGQVSLSDTAPPYNTAKVDNTFLPENTPASYWIPEAGIHQSRLLLGYPLQPFGTTHSILWLEKTRPTFLTLSSQAMTTLLSASLVIVGMIVALFMLFAFNLSRRIIRLNKYVGHHTTPNATSKGSLPELTTSDEIGDLARSFDALFRKAGSYTRYLKQLSQQLAHEIRTPLAIVRSSLDMAQLTTKDKRANTYIERALSGANRLNSILSAMSEAHEIEQLTTDAEKQLFDLEALLHQLTQAYQTLYPEYQFRFSRAPGDWQFAGSEELSAQMMEKLLNNAVEFSQRGSLIEVTLTKTDEAWNIAVINTGTHLPDGMQHQIFDSMVSLRDTPSSTPHLGLGLYIVKLITRFHGGYVNARNTLNGVTVTVTLPKPHSL